jgi:hypothetical protein
MLNKEILKDYTLKINRCIMSGIYVFPTGVTIIIITKEGLLYTLPSTPLLSSMERA